MLDHGVATTQVRAAPTTVTLGLATVAWVVAVRQMTGMDMGVGTDLGSFGFFAGTWVVMMVAMMLPGAAPVIAQQTSRRAPLFVATYLGVWSLVGVVVYAAYRPHGSVAAGAVVIAAGVYELTPLKRYFRRRCRECAGSEFDYGLCCIGATVGLMAMLIALGVMSITWMVVIAVVVTAQKLLPAKAAVDVPLALAIAGLGIWILAAPGSVPGLIPSMTAM